MANNVTERAMSKPQLANGKSKTLTLMTLTAAIGLICFWKAQIRILPLWSTPCPLQIMILSSLIPSQFGIQFFNAEALWTVLEAQFSGTSLIQEQRRSIHEETYVD
ncbi:MAG TPA: hypothetical protein VKY85_10300 [Candidatus Angelobacter sp.]|nr:hypothetical protein [Candidatus Angelobacter sp.]